MAIPPKFLIQTVQFVWKTMWQTMMSQLAPSDRQGNFRRAESEFRDSIGSEKFPAANKRYRLYVGLTCPWAHRTMVTRVLKGLEDCIEMSVAIADVSVGGWRLENDPTGCRSMKELYQLAQPRYSGRCSVPVLWDCETNSIVNNESSEIIVMLNDHFNEWAKNPERDLYPEDLQKEGDRLNDLIYCTVNNGVYKCGFATTQSAYNEAVTHLFETLDLLDKRLGDRRYLLGDTITLCDVRLFTTLIRFDLVYHSLFKCDRRRIRDYENLWGYLRDIYQQPGIPATCPLETIKREYYTSLFPLNPSGIVPFSIDPNAFTMPHNRAAIVKSNSIS
ncbi:glutathione S-transferase family protein [[Limnothrix rosea] IAM M-220]|uniref:glutathione S-transferase family protein n=1 Tax=[Limnothrix rosea] IAM M-220 TaxID=454133 RepID=UPI0009685D37|nr:glutathione S-transferase C-terminal domain-containing protein [[Limnothrix rosea] IAM M-220]OKH14197.1 glutathione-dependent reductase [[Limnothrix rosea] IAM M-220]